jgi:hypothetical protein
MFFKARHCRDHLEVSGRPLPAELGRHLEQDEAELSEEALVDLRLPVVEPPVEEPLFAVDWRVRPKSTAMPGARSR